MGRGRREHGEGEQGTNYQGAGKKMLSKTTYCSTVNAPLQCLLTRVQLKLFLRREVREVGSATSRASPVYTFILSDLSKWKCGKYDWPEFIARVENYFYMLNTTRSDSNS
jgi:hypothetical protein